MGVVVAKLESGYGLPTLEVEHEALPSVTKQDNVTVVHGHSLCAAGKGGVALQPVAHSRHNNLLCCGTDW